MRISGWAVGVLMMLVAITPMAGCSSSATPVHQTHIVEIVQMKFNPAAIKVHQGDTVVFVNNDLVTHNIMEDSGKTWQSPMLQQGNKWSLVVTQSAGYYCTLHPVMKGTISVQ